MSVSSKIILKQDSMPFNSKTDQWLWLLNKTSNLTFIVAGLTFVVYFILEDFKTGLISNYFDLNLLLVIALASGLLKVLLPPGDEEENPSFKNNFLYFAAIALLAASFSYQHLQIFQEMSYFISLIIGSGLFIILKLYASYD